MLPKLKIVIRTIVLYRTHSWCFDFGRETQEFMRTHPGVSFNEACYRVGAARGEKFVLQFEKWTDQVTDTVKD